MAKPDPALLTPARYPFHCTLQTRYTDVDVNMHVNNVAMVEVLQESRVRFHAACGYESSIKGMSAMTVHASVDYLGEAKYANLETYIAGLEIGNTSHTIAQLIVQDGKPVATARAVMVCVKDGRPVPNDPAFAKAMESWMIRE